MTTFNDLDFGPSHAWIKTRVGQVVGSSLIEGSRTIAWPRGRTLEEQPVDLYVTPWQALGGFAANTRGAMLFLLKQLEELAGNPDLQPIYIQWNTTAAPGAFSAAEYHDGWYVVTLIEPPYRRYVVTGGIVTVPMTAVLVAPAAPSSLAVRYDGAALSSTFTQLSTPALGLPIGSSAQSGGFSRTGAEGAVPIAQPPLSGAGVINPVPFIRPGTIAGLFTGQCRVFDSVNIGANPVPLANGTFVNANWVEVKGTQHDFASDAILTNGLLLLRFPLTASEEVYFWNTQGTAGWQDLGSLGYKDNSLNVGSLREINLDKVGLEEVRARVRVSTVLPAWAEWRQKLFRGMRHALLEFQPLTQQPNTGFAIDFSLVNALKIAYNDVGIRDIPVEGAGNVLGPSSTVGIGVAFGTTANGPLLGYLYQNPSSGGQPSTGTTTELGYGDTTGPVAGTFVRYGFFVIPWVSAPNLQAEGESGTLGTGWSSVADAGASGGNTAKAASGTLTGNADLFGVSYVPTPGLYDVWFRVKVTSNAGAAAEMTLGLWDVTSAAFVANASTTFRANQWATGYTWLKANTGLVTPTAAHNMQFRAVTAATLGTDWFIDEAVLAPRQTAFLGQGDFPGDIYSQFAFDRTTRWARG